MSTKSEDFQKHIDEIIKRDPRYKDGAYYFVSQAVPVIAKDIMDKAGITDPHYHITGQELVNGMINLLHEKYGCLAKDVVEFWGINDTLDFGNIVFNLIDENLLSASANDSIEDFYTKGTLYQLLISDYLAPADMANQPMPQIRVNVHKQD